MICRCECPFGYHGPACDKEIFPACKLTAKSTEMHCGDRMPRSCECLRQCRAFFCPNKGRCETPRESWYVQCFERIAKNTSDLARAHGGKVGPGVTVKGPGDPFLRGPVYSDVPEQWEEQKGLVEWFQGLRDDLPRKRLKQRNATFVSASIGGFLAAPHHIYVSALLASSRAVCNALCGLFGWRSQVPGVLSGIPAHTAGLQSAEGPADRISH